LVFVALVLRVSIAVAERGSVVLSSGADPVGAEVRNRTEDELRVAGFGVLIHDGEGDPQQLAETEGALAVVTVMRVDVAAQSPFWVITVVDRVTGKTTERRVAETPEAPPDASRIAILAVELLYASLLEIEAATPARGPVEPPPAVTREVRRRLTEPERAPRWAFRGGAAIAATPGGLPPPGGLTIGGSGWSPAGVGVDLAGFVGLTPITVEQGQMASARLAFATVRGNVVGVLWPTRVFSLSGGVGGGVLVARARGSAAAPLEGAGDVTAVALAGAVGSGSWRFKRRLRLRLDLTANAAFPELDVRFAGETTATAGRPWFEAATTVEYALR
jgi:hypothetical protein